MSNSQENSKFGGLAWQGVCDTPSVEHTYKYASYTSEVGLYSKEYLQAYLDALTDIYITRQRKGISDAQMQLMYANLHGNFYADFGDNKCQRPKHPLSYSDIRSLDLAPQHLAYLAHECFEITFNPESDILVQHIVREDVPDIVKYLIVNYLRAISTYNTILLTATAMHYDLSFDAQNCSAVYKVKLEVMDIESDQNSNTESGMLCTYMRILEGNLEYNTESKIKELVQYLYSKAENPLRDYHAYHLMAPIASLLSYRLLWEFQRQNIPVSYLKRLEYCRKMLDYIEQESYIVE